MGRRMCDSTKCKEPGKCLEVWVTPGGLQVLIHLCEEHHQQSMAEGES